MRARSVWIVTSLVLLSGGVAAAWALAVVWPRIPYLSDPESWLEGVWEVDYDESNDHVLASGLWRKYDFEATGRLNGADGVCAGPVSFWIVTAHELRLHEYDPVSELIPLPPDSPRPENLPLGEPTTRYLVEFVNGNTALLEDPETDSRVTLRRVVGARHFYATDD